MNSNKFLSNYIKAKDIRQPQVVTIAAVESETFTNDGKEKDALVVLFKEVEQGVVLCKDSIRQLQELCDSAETDSWVGRQVELFNDPTVKFQGKNVGGLRFRAPSKGKK